MTRGQPARTGGMQIFVKTAAGPSICLDTSSTDAVDVIHDRLRARCETEETSRLLYGSKQLMCGRTLADYNIQNGDTVFELLRLRGGGIFLTFFKTMLNKTIVVELKNDVKIQGVLESIDQFLNFKLNDIVVMEAEKYPHLMSVRNCFIRGSVVRYVQVPPEDVNTELLQDSCRKEHLKEREKN
eukprot:COSAG05_NODE_1058_length_6003_cov_11.053862_3_plen_184_part_00